MNQQGERELPGLPELTKTHGSPVAIADDPSLVESLKQLNRCLGRKK